MLFHVRVHTIIVSFLSRNLKTTIPEKLCGFRKATNYLTQSGCTCLTTMWNRIIQFHKFLSRHDKVAPRLPLMCPSDCAMCLTHNFINVFSSTINVWIKNECDCINSINVRSNLFAINLLSYQKLGKIVRL